MYKTLLMTILITIFSTIIDAQTPVAPPTGLVSWWNFDGNALDARSRNNGTLVGDATFAAANVGQGLSLDGNGDYLTIGDPANIKFSGTDFTVEGWFRTTDLPTNGGACGSRYPIFAYAYGYNVEIDLNGRLSFYKYTTVGTSVGVVSSGVVPINQFNHFAAVHTPTEMRIYLNGVLVGTQPIADGTVYYNPLAPPHVGYNPCGPNQYYFKGLIDELAIYGRALTVAEIQSINAAGTAGKFKPAATDAPANLIGWWSGDGSAFDLAGVGNGSFEGAGTRFAVGKVGQAFQFDGSSQSVRIPDSPALEVSNQVTLEAWIKPTFVDNYRQIISKFGDVGSYAYQFGLAPNGALRTDLCQSGGPSYEFLTSPPNAITANQWQHVAMTFNGGLTKLYVNGAEVASTTLTITSIFSGGTADLTIGRDPVSSSPQYFNGQIDEPSVYNRALTVGEIQSIFNAGIAGKLKQNPTPTGSNVAVQTGRDATVTFPAVSTTGNTEQTPIDLALLPALPSGVTTSGFAYDISTAATYTGSPRVCFKLPSITNSVTFGNLRIAHLENGVWVNRTELASIDFATQTICTDGLTSLSPFAIVSGFAPTAANVSVSGRVRTADGRGISNVVVSITNTRTGETSSVRTGTFGAYKFGELPAGDTFILSVNSKKFVFSSPTRVLNLTESIGGEDFVADVSARTVPTGKVGPSKASSPGLEQK